MSTKYNGWTNYETWKVNLELIDSERMAESLGDYKDFDQFVAMIREDVEEYVFMDIDNNSFAAGTVQQFLNAVNWYEIAEHIQEGYSE